MARRSRSTPARCPRRRSRSSGARRKAFICFIPYRLKRSSAQGGLNYVRTRIAVPEFAKANVRTEGPPRLRRPDMAARRRRMRARPEAHDGHSRGRSAAAPDARASPQVRAAKPGAATHRAKKRYREAIEPIHQRITRGAPVPVCPLRSQDRRTSMRRSIRHSPRSRPR